MKTPHQISTIIPFLVASILPSQGTSVSSKVTNNGNRMAIVNGKDADEGEYPWFASDSNIGCGAVLIHEDILLSAAHCFDADPDESAFAVDSTVCIGHLQDDCSDAADIVEIEELLVHPEYDPFGSRLDNDIMVIKVKAPSSQEPIRWNDDAAVPLVDQTVGVIGLGLLDDPLDIHYSDPLYPDILQELDIQVISTDECMATIEVNDPIGGINGDLMICAIANDKDSCQGDSGGPLFTTTDPPVLVGLVSFGTSTNDEDLCNSQGEFGVYTRISAYQEFIETSICTMSSNPPTYCGSLTSQEKILLENPASYGVGISLTSVVVAATMILVAIS